VHQSRLAIKRQLRLVAEDVGDAGVDPPGDAEVARDQLLAEGHELLLVDRGLLVGEDEEADVVLLDQHLDLVHELLRIARAVLPPELPLRTE
jgi:hypothetical protein